MPGLIGALGWADPERLAGGGREADVDRPPVTCKAALSELGTTG